MPSLNRLILLYCSALLFSTYSLFGAYQSTIQFGGVDEKTVNLLKSASRLIKLEESPPPTLAALHSRAEADVLNFIKVMHSLAYYNAQVHLDIQTNQNPILIQFQIDPGPQYPLVKFEIIPSIENEDCPYSYEEISLEEIGVVIGEPALPKTIINAEESLLNLLEENGYPLAEITQSQVFADIQAKTVSVVLHVKSGPYCYFGETTVKGQCLVRDAVFKKKISWEEGLPYKPCQVEETQIALESTGLFSSISITHAEEACNGMLPMEIQVVEGKHHSVAAGVSYSSDLGPGVLAEWENRNVRGMGEKLSFNANVAVRAQEGTLQYVIPDFRRRHQDLLFLAELEHEKTKGFTASSFSLSSIIERQINLETRISYGIMLKQLKDIHSDNNREFNLVKFPAQFRWSDANNILDPSFGQSISFKIIPSFQVFEPRFAYCTNTFSGSCYKPLTSDHQYVLAGKATIGAILGTTRHAIPPSERFYAGSDTLLRGYKYLTVSPLGEDHKPLGGRSMMIFSLELRKRSANSIGWVCFYDFGNVIKSTMPSLHQKLLQSVGVGIRYATPVGPLRLDFAVPLNPRRHVDNRFQIYLSIGQAF